MVLNTTLLEDLLPELDIVFSVPEDMMTEARNGRLDYNNAIKCDVLDKGENAVCEKKSQ